MKILFTAILTFFTIVLFAQDSTALREKWAKRDALEAQVKVNRRGVGNSTFSITLPKLSGLIKLNTNLKTLESQFSSWSSDAYQNRVGYSFNEKTQDHDIAVPEIHYETRIKNISYVVIAEVQGSLAGKITKLTVIAPINGLTLAQFKQALRNSGYLLNENLSDIYNKEAWQKKGQPLFTIKRNANGTTSIGVF